MMDHYDMKDEGHVTQRGCCAATSASELGYTVHTAITPLQITTGCGLDSGLCVYMYNFYKIKMASAMKCLISLGLGGAFIITVNTQSGY